MYQRKRQFSGVRAVVAVAISISVAALIWGNIEPIFENMKTADMSAEANSTIDAISPNVWGGLSLAVILVVIVGLTILLRLTGVI